MLTRRQLLIGGTALAWWPGGCATRTATTGPRLVNDIHSGLNATPVDRIERPRSVAEVVSLVERARAEGKAISIAAGRHAMGGQQFGSGTVLVDTGRLARIIRFDRERGEIEVEAGIQWPALMEYLLSQQDAGGRQWAINQKQTGADRLSLGGALAANVHGRGLCLKPFIADVESFVLVDAGGVPRTCSRHQNVELFRLAIGGYGLLGPITSVTLRLAQRQLMERVVEVIDIEDLMAAFEHRIAGGFTFGDFQYATFDRSDDFLRKGVFSCYRPTDASRWVPGVEKELGLSDWQRLLYLSHTDKRTAFEQYAAYYLSTSGQLYWSDTHQMSLYVDDYHAALDRQLGARDRASEMITEIYVPRSALAAYMDDVRRYAIAEDVNIVYGTIRLIERDEESLLAWARQPYACIIFNLHVVHNRAGLERAAAAFRRLIDLAIPYGGSYYLTYHRWATRQQVERCHPHFVEFLKAKRAYDPEERFQSDWYRHYRGMFRDVL
jgi:FAD/FMN-containing dehydrogenase